MKTGMLSILDLNMPGKEKLIKEISYIDTQKELRLLKYYKKNNEVICGDENGIITVVSLKTGDPLVSFEAHKSVMTQMYWNEDARLLVTSGKDKSIKFWKAPEKWINEEIARFEQNELINQNASDAMLKLGKSKSTLYEDTEDSDLNGWDLY